MTTVLLLLISAAAGARAAAVNGRVQAAPDGGRFFHRECNALPVITVFDKFTSH